MSEMERRTNIYPHEQPFWDAVFLAAIQSPGVLVIVKAEGSFDEGGARLADQAVYQRRLRQHRPPPDLEPTVFMCPAPVPPAPPREEADEKLFDPELVRQMVRAADNDLAQVQTNVGGTEGFAVPSGVDVDPYALAAG